MQHLINQLYEGTLKDMRKTVSRYEYENRDARHKLDTAELYLQINEVKKALQEAGIEIPETEPQKRDEEVVLIASEDKRNVEEELAKSTLYLMEFGDTSVGFWGKLKSTFTKKGYTRSTLNENVQRIMENEGNVSLTEEVLSAVSKTKEEAFLSGE